MVLEPCFARQIEDREAFRGRSRANEDGVDQADILDLYYVGINSKALIMALESAGVVRNREAARGCARTDGEMKPIMT